MLAGFMILKDRSVVFFLLAFAQLLSCCGPGSGRPEDPRKWTHEQLMEGARLLSPSWANRIKILYVGGRSYQMGYQHGTLLKEELRRHYEELEGDPLWYSATTLAMTKGPDESGKTYVDYSVENALDFVREECEGMADAAGHMTRDECIGMNSLLWVLDDMLPRYAPGLGGMLSCSQFAAAEGATVDGTLLHGRNMDWLAVDTVMQNPVLVVRRPEGGLVHVIMVWPGMVGGLTGMSEAGVAIGINDAGCKEEHRDPVGIAPLQMATKILAEARTMEEVNAVIESSDHASCQIFLVSHGPSRSASVFEMSASGVGSRGLDETGVLYTTNHFVQPDTLPYQEGYTNLENLETNSISRYTRLSERLCGESLPPHPGLAPDAPDYAYSKIDVEVAIDLLRDPLDLRPDQNRFCFPCTEYQDGGWALGNNHNLQSFVMAPEDLRFWMAAGWDDECVNAIYNPFIGFDLNDLLDGDPNSDLVPSYDPPYNHTYCNGIHGN